MHAKVGTGRLARRWIAIVFVDINKLTMRVRSIGIDEIVRNLVFSLATLCVLTSCQNIGPTAVRVGMPEYNAAILETSDEITMLNFVRIRYSESPYFMEVTNVFTSPSFTAAVGGGGSVTTDLGNSAELNAELSYSESPTIVYTPVGGAQFSTRLLEPVGLHTISLLSQGGWNVDRLLRLCVQRINGVWNAEIATGPVRATPVPQYETFRRVAETLHDLETSKELVFEYAARHKARVSNQPIEFDILPEAKKRPEVQQLFADLELDPNAESYFITNGKHAPGDRNVTIVTRPLLATMFYLSKGVVVPERDLKRKAVTVTVDEQGELFDWQLVTGDLFRIESSDTRPESAFRAVRYRNSWFYIRDDDVESKDTFMLFGSLLSLRAGETPKSATALTLPVR
jgi:hypothetical protein